MPDVAVPPPTDTVTYTFPYTVGWMCAVTVTVVAPSYSLTLDTSVVSPIVAYHSKIPTPLDTPFTL